MTILSTNDQFNDKAVNKKPQGLERYESGEIMASGPVDTKGNRDGLWSIYDKEGETIAQYNYTGGMLIDDKGQPITGHIHKGATGMINDML